MSGTDAGEVTYAREPLGEVWGSVGAFHRVAREVQGLVTDIDRGMRATLFAREIIAATVEGRAKPTKAAMLRYEAFEEFGKRAQRAIDGGHSLLHKNLLMGLWGSLEAAIEDIVAYWILANPRYFEFEGLQKLKVAAGPFLQLDEDARARFLVREMQRSRGAHERLGVGQFESLLGQVGLGGPVEEPHRKLLLEAQQLRHVIAHRGGVADADFLSHCTHLGYSVGDTVVVSPEQFEAIVESMVAYVEEIVRRVEASLETTAPTLWSGLQEVKRKHTLVHVARPGGASDAVVAGDDLT